MNEIKISNYDAIRWIATLAAADGVITPAERKVIKEFAQTYNIDTRLIYRLAYAIASNIDLPEVEIFTQTEMIGRKFENFIVSLITDNSDIKLQSWRGDKIYGKTYPLENLLPDLRIKQTIIETQKEYHIECKYRSSIPNGIFDISSQLSRYKKLLSNDRNCELFIALGVGGMPSNPDTLYIIPCRDIPNDNLIYLNKCQNYICNKTKADFIEYFKTYFKTI